jgi:chromosome transmission fidelity protein 1
MPAPTLNEQSGGDQPLDFHHPFTPYDVQLEFMRAAYDVLEKGDGQVGILESPTGTVSSLRLVLSHRNHRLMAAPTRENHCHSSALL